MFNKHDISRNECQLVRGQAKNGYDWWWHSFTAYNVITGEAKPFYIEFYLTNPAYKEDGLVLGQSQEAILNHKKPSYLMVNVGTWGKDHAQLHRFFAWKDIEVRFKKPFSVRADDCYLDETSTRGSVHVTHEDSLKKEYMCDEGSISWNLSIQKDIAFNVGYGAGKLFRGLQLFEMFWHAEGIKSYFEGEITYNGILYKVRKEDCYGYSDKNWGKNFTSPWLWLSSNNLTSKLTGKKLSNSVFDIGGGRPKVGCIALKGKLLSAFYYEGKCFEFNFSKFWTFARTKFEAKETEEEIVWHVEQKSTSGKMVVDITCRKEEMLLINYESPDGKKRHNRLWNGGNGVGIIRLYKGKKLIDEIEAHNVGCEYGEYAKGTK